jgi:uncharacterized protein (DUF849 family)
MSPHLPVTPEQIVEESLAAAQAGATIVHLHARRPEDGQPTNDYEYWEQFIPEIRSRSDVIINMSTGGGATAEKRVDAALRLRPDIATVVVSSMNYGLFKKAEGFSSFQHDWEKTRYGEAAYDVITQNSFAKIDRMIDLLIDHDILIEFECYDVGHLYVLDYHLAKKKIRRPLVVQFLTGILGGIPTEVDHLVHMRVTAERLFGKDVELFTHGTLRNNIMAATCGGMMGTNVRVGQEDNLFERPGVPYKSNADQVRKIRRIFDELGVEVASLAEARKRLGLSPSSASASLVKNAS